LLSKRIP
jgi:GNAT superfamily N-acetyltransferase